MSQTQPQRGSQKLRAQFPTNGATATQEELKAALSIPSDLTAKVAKWQTRGTPAYFELEATLELESAALQAAVSKLLANEYVNGLRILKYGLPAVDNAIVQIEIAAHE